MLWGVGQSGHVAALTSAPRLAEGSQVWDKQRCAEELGGDQLSRAVTVKATGLHSPGASAAAALWGAV